MPQKRKQLKIEEPNLWYLVGLITSDGCLSSDGRHINITSKEQDFLNNVNQILGAGNRIGTKDKGKINQTYQIQFSNRNFYDFLLSIGLTQNKSLTLGALKVPIQYFVDFLRGLIDGDGCIRRWIHPVNFQQQWSLRISSGSKKFLEWLDGKTKDCLKCYGKIYQHNKKGSVYILKFGKMAAREIVKKCYYEGCFGLDRKIKLANECLISYRGWSRSKTVLN